MAMTSDHEVQFTQNAIEQMRSQGVSAETVAQVVTGSDPIETTNSGNPVYSVEEGEQRITALAAEGTSPPLVMAVSVTPA